eukprot:CAMPEP_0177216782 /NCGR_PEP_ID=MMETSP0367-20130122/34938_1 /TAXON_ID=447022 ORGANISM="Scrippsiella hangoei-like, Strain SHHI-4" /NCGR_SAMPLE_ID=MMETSP0367 /ASSEMBLY_ACC=CAM_ASM_000362 /LENGTH=161 /DNA_ID=CAMNT_0018666315 /DNA_START=461 /DNA_END=947 /DNA_ORIENTATION=+
MGALEPSRGAAVVTFTTTSSLKEWEGADKMERVSSTLVMVTNAKGFFVPVALSTGTYTSFTAPKKAKYALKVSSSIPCVKPVNRHGSTEHLKQELEPFHCCGTQRTAGWKEDHDEKPAAHHDAQQEANPSAEPASETKRSLQCQASGFPAHSAALQETHRL